MQAAPAQAAGRCGGLNCVAAAAVAIVILSANTAAAAADDDDAAAAAADKLTHLHCTGLQTVRDGDRK